MRTILEKNEAEIVVNRSTFIGIVLHVTSKNSVKQYLDEIKKEYPKAKHYCYAYIINGDKKCSDDGEPAKTAGRPLLDLLEVKELNEVLLVVVRYFGGVLLGAARLMSTYIEAGTRVIDDSDKFTEANKYVYHMELTYSEFDQLKHLSKRLSFSLENEVFDTKISVDVLADEADGELLANNFPHASIDVIGTRKIYLKDY